MSYLKFSAKKHAMNNYEETNCMEISNTETKNLRLPFSMDQLLMRNESGSQPADGKV